jgi:hypothetical protein
MNELTSIFNNASMLYLNNKNYHKLESTIDLTFQKLPVVEGIR